MGVWIEIDVALYDDTENVSLPSWECGLKCLSLIFYYERVMSLPSWECGLKFGQSSGFSGISRHSLRGSVDWNRWEKKNSHSWSKSYYLKKNEIKKLQKNISSELLTSFGQQLTKTEDIKVEAVLNWFNFNKAGDACQEGNTDICTFFRWEICVII